MSNQIYIHYGSTSFDPAKGFPIQNRDYWVKPKGGLWASRIDASYGWKAWCERKEFCECDPSNAFRFIIKNGYEIYTISTIKQLHALLQINSSRRYFNLLGYCIDFEACLKLGIDAIELCWYGDEYKDISDGDLYNELYGWDCDSILVLNPNAILVI